VPDFSQEPVSERVMSSEASEPSEDGGVWDGCYGAEPVSAVLWGVGYRVEYSSYCRGEERGYPRSGVCLADYS